MKKKTGSVLKQAPLKKAVDVKWLKTRVVSEDKSSSKKLKIAYGITGGLIVALACLLAISTKYSFVQVKLAGIEIKQSQNREDLKEKLESDIKSYRLTVEAAKKQKNYSLKKAGVVVDLESSIDQALETKKPKNLFKRLAFWQKKDLGLSLSANQKKLEKFVERELSIPITKSKNASVVINGGVAKVTKEQSGLSYTLKDPQATLLAHVSALNKTSIFLQKYETKPSISLKEANKAKKTVDTILAKKANFIIEGVIVSAAPADIGAWIEINPVKSSKSIDVTINTGKVLDYLNAIATPYVSPPKNAILAPGSNNKILIPGKNGVDIVNKETVATSVAKKILSSDQVNETLPVAYQTYKTIKAEPKPKWIAVDLSSKIMYVYEKTHLVRTFLISAGAPGTPTVEGTFTINSKLASQDMSGPNADGSRYFQPNVPYVNYFYADYAIHGVYWRPDSYLGNVNASHGCVGMNVSDSAWIFNWAPVGTTVITFS